MATRYNWMADTTEEAFRVLVGLNRKLTPGEKIARALDLSAMMMRLSEESVRRQYPHAGEREVFLRAAARRLDRETMVRMYGWDPLAAEK
jgi:hypothetical protein